MDEETKKKWAAVGEALNREIQGNLQQARARRPLSELMADWTRESSSARPIVYVSGHLDLTEEEFAAHYVPALTEALAKQSVFIVGDACGADTFAQRWLLEKRAVVTVYHMLTTARHNLSDRPTVGGFSSDAERDEAMTRASTCDVAWVRPGREKSGTAKNLARRARTP
jgi:hypothetical protein